MPRLRASVPALLLVVVPLFLPNDFWVNIAALSVIFMTLAVGLNICAGYTGMFSLSQGAFFGIGAYASAYAAVHWGLSLPLSIAFGVGATAVVGAVLAVPAVRVRGSYLAIATLGFGTITADVLNNWVDVTRGPAGLVGIPNLPTVTVGGFQIDFVHKIYWYYVLLAVLGVVLLLERVFFARSRVGLVLRTIREDEISARSCGVNTFSYKVLAFFASAVVAGLVGSFYSFYLSFLTPDLFDVSLSIQVMTIVIVGGLGSVPGVMVSALLLTAIPEALNVAGHGSVLRFVVYGAILVTFMIFLPGGLADGWRRLTERAGRREAGGGSPPAAPDDATRQAFAGQTQASS